MDFVFVIMTSIPGCPDLVLLLTLDQHLALGRLDLEPLDLLGLECPILEVFDHLEDRSQELEVLGSFLKSLACQVHLGAMQPNPTPQEMI